MRNWATDSGGVGSEELNGTLSVCDAVVDDGMGTDDANVFGDISDALAAGAKTIMVLPGSYSGFTISSDNVSIRGVAPVMSGSGTANVAVINGSITKAANMDGVHLENLALHPTTGAALTHYDGRDCVYRGLHAYGGTSYHFLFNESWDRVLVEDCTSVNGASQGFRLSYAMTAQSWHSLFRNCRVQGAASNGFSIGSSDTGTGWRYTNLVNCSAWDVGNYGFIMGLAWVGSLIGCHSYSNDLGGFYFYNPGSALRSRSIIGCTSRYNTTYGFVRSGATYTAAETYAGCVASGNVIAGWYNYSAIPTTCL